MKQQELFGLETAGHLEKLALYMPIVEKVHGKHHPEFHEVRELAEGIIRKAKAAGKERPGLQEEFARLREITGNYLVPGDVCESYEAVYRMLSDLDRAYEA